MLYLSLAATRNNAIQIVKWQDTGCMHLDTAGITMMRARTELTYEPLYRNRNCKLPNQPTANRLDRITIVEFLTSVQTAAG